MRPVTNEFTSAIGDLPEPTDAVARDRFDQAQEEEGGLRKLLLWKLLRPLWPAYDSAEALYRETIRIEPGCAKVYTALGILLARKGELEEALQCFEEAHEHYPGNAWILANLSQCYREMRDSAKAQEYYRMANDELLSPKGKIALSEGDIALLRELWSDVKRIIIYLNLLEKDTVLGARLSTIQIEIFADAIEKKMSGLEKSSDDYRNVKRIASYLRRNVKEIQGDYPVHI